MTTGFRHVTPAWLALAAWLFAHGEANAIETAAKQALVIDYQTGSVLFEKDADAQIQPASMTKLMTLYVLFDQLKQGKVSLTDEFTVSENAWSRGVDAESNMFVDLNSKVKVEDLIRGIAIQSGNDACKVIAEGIAGSEEAYVKLMNKKAQEIGLLHTHFENVDGLEEQGHLMTPRDIVLMAEHVYADFPEYYHYFAEKEFTYNKIKQGNRNPLLYKDLGVDGLKTGHLDVSGFGLVASAEQDGRRIFVLVDGLSSMQARSDAGTQLIEWAFQSFQNIKLAKAGDTLETAPVWYGAEDAVPLTVAKDLIATLPKGSHDDLTAKAVFQGPITAPIAAGQPLGKLVISASGGTTEVPLVAGAAVNKVGIFGHIFATLRYWVMPPKFTAPAAAASNG